MADFAPVLHAPVAVPAPRGTENAEVTVTDCSSLTVSVVKSGWSADLSAVSGVDRGQVRRQRWNLADDAMPVLVAGTAPDEWLVLAPPAARPTLAGHLRQLTMSAGDLVSVVEMTYGVAVLRISGGRAPNVLAKLCSVDLSDDGCPDGTALRAGIAGVPTTVMRTDRADRPSYLMECDRSFGQSLFEAVLDAGAEFAVEAGGFEPPGV